MKDELRACAEHEALRMRREYLRRRCAEEVEEREGTPEMTTRLQMLIAAAESGDAEAMTDLGLIHARGEERQRVDLPKAVSWYRMAAAAGSRRAMGNLAYLYLNGISVRRDPVRAVALYEEAARGPSPALDQFLYDLASCYELGVGVPPDPARAIELYAKSARLGLRLARLALARLGAESAAA